MTTYSKTITFCGKIEILQLFQCHLKFKKFNFALVSNSNKSSNYERLNCDSFQKL